MELKKTEHEPDKSLLGLLVKKKLSVDFCGLKDVIYSHKLLKNYSRSLRVFKLENDINVAFYVDSDCVMNAAVFDNSDQVITRFSKLFYNMEKKQIEIVKLEGSFVFFVTFDVSGKYICFEGYSSRRLLIKLDEQFNYVNHKILDSKIRCVTANSSLLIGIDSSYKVTSFDSDLYVIQSQVANYIEERVGGETTLAELKKQSGILKVNFENGADQIREYCAELRTHVHLETEILH